MPHHIRLGGGEVEGGGHIVSPLSCMYICQVCLSCPVCPVSIFLVAYSITAVCTYICQVCLSCPICPVSIFSEKISVLDSNFIQRYIIIKCRSS